MTAAHSKETNITDTGERKTEQNGPQTFKALLTCYQAKLTFC